MSFGCGNHLRWTPWRHCIASRRYRPRGRHEEAIGGGALDDDLHVDMPAAPAILTSASVYDASWITVQCAGWPQPSNVLFEINNSHAVRFAETLRLDDPAGTSSLVFDPWS